MPEDASLTALYHSIDPTIKGKIKNHIFDAATPDAGTLTTQDPLSPYKGDTIEMSPLQWLSTYDSNFKKTNPEYAALNAYYHPHQTNRSMGYLMGDKLNSLYHGYGSAIGRTLDKGPLAGGLLAMAPGLLAGALGTGALNMLTGNPLSSDVLKNALIGGLATGSLGAFSGYLRKYKPQWNAPAKRELVTPQDLAIMNNYNKVQALGAGLHNKAAATKRAYASAAEAQSKIVQLIQSAPGLSFNERSQLTAGVAQLSSTDLTQLSSMLTGVAGATVGAIVARFLLNKGLIGTVLGAIFGGRIAKSVFGPAVPKNDLGQASFQGRDLLGQYL